MIKQLSLFDIDLVNDDFIITDKTVRIASKDLSFTNDATGEKVKNIAAFGKTEVIKDNAEFLKLYAKGYAFLFDVELIASIELLATIMKISQSNKDTNVFPLSYELAKEYGFKKQIAQYSRAKKELINKNVIERIDKYNHRYNPTMFFNGSRVALFREVILKGSENE